MNLKDYLQHKADCEINDLIGCDDRVRTCTCGLDEEIRKWESDLQSAFEAGQQSAFIMYCELDSVYVDYDIDFKQYLTTLTGKK